MLLELKDAILGLKRSISKKGSPEICIQYSVEITDESIEEEQFNGLYKLSNKFVGTFGPIFEAIERNEKQNS